MKKITYSKLIKNDFKIWHDDFPFETNDKISYTEGFNDGVWNMIWAIKESGLLSPNEIFTIIDSIDPKGESLAHEMAVDWMED